MRHVNQIESIINLNISHLFQETPAGERAAGEIGQAPQDFAQ